MPAHEKGGRRERDTEIKMRLETNRIHRDCLCDS